MKKKLLVAGALALVIVGCATSKTAYQSIYTTEVAVSAANRIYLDQVVTGQVPTNSVPTVEAIFNDTQLALHSAAAIASGGSSAAVPAATLAKATGFTNAVRTAGGKL